MEDKIMCIAIRVLEATVNNCGSLYEAVRWCRPIDKMKAPKIKYVLAVVNYGNHNYKVEDIFKTQKGWEPINGNECPNKICPKCKFAEQPNKQPCGKMGFTCTPPLTVADAEIKELKGRYLGNIIPMGRNPIAYISL